MPAMTSLEMPLARQADANAFGMLLLLAACGWLLHLTVECARQHWRTRKLLLAFEESKDPQRLLERTLKTLAETPGLPRLPQKTLAAAALTRRSPSD